MWEINTESASYDSYGNVYVGSLASNSSFVWIQHIEGENSTFRLSKLDGEMKQVVLQSEDGSYINITDSQLIIGTDILEGSWIKRPDFPNST